MPPRRSAWIQTLPSPDFDVLIIGAGAAGLAATRELERAGKRVCCLEARDRIGGRILTVHDPPAPVPIEMGAEFVHGRPPEIFDLVDKAGLNLYEISGRIVGGGDTDRVMEDIKRFGDDMRDETLLEFVTRRDYPDDERHAAVAFIEGFDAARAERIGIAGLAKDERAADRIEGDRSFRILNGYHSLLLAIGASAIRLNTIVERVEWRRGGATVHVRSALIAGERESLHSRRVLVTVPLGVLQAGAIHFEPEPGDILRAARVLEFGDVFRVSLRFDRPFWEEKPELSGAAFIFSDEPVFPTWWTTRPVEAAIITGWSAGPKADPLRGKDRSEVLDAAMRSLERTVGSPAARLEHAWFHDLARRSFFARRL